MKIFNTLTELWDFSIICEICQKNTTPLLLITNPFALAIPKSSYQKRGNLLIIEQTNVNITKIYTIDCQSNTLDAQEAFISSYSLFAFEFNCDHCKRYHIEGTGSIIDSKLISNIGVRFSSYFIENLNEKFFLKKEDDKITIFPLNESYGMDIRKNPIIVDSFNLDFSNKNLFNKIKTILTFS